MKARGESFGSELGLAIDEWISGTIILCVPLWLATYVFFPSFTILDSIAGLTLFFIFRFLISIVIPNAPQEKE